MQAEDGVGLPEDILEKPDFEKAAKYYFLFIKFDILWSLNYFALIVLNFFEVGRLLVLSSVEGNWWLFLVEVVLRLPLLLQKPLWCARYSADACNERDYFYLGQLPYLTGAESLLFEVSIRTVLHIAKHYFRSPYLHDQSSENVQNWRYCAVDSLTGHYALFIISVLSQEDRYYVSSSLCYVSPFVKLEKPLGKVFIHKLSLSGHHADYTCDPCDFSTCIWRAACLLGKTSQPIEGAHFMLYVLPSKYYCEIWSQRCILTFVQNLVGMEIQANGQEFIE